MARYMFRKFINGLINRAEFKLGRDRLISYPTILFVEPTNRCSLSCPLCPTGKGYSYYPTGTMTLDVFSRIIGELGPWAKSLHLYNWGEPLLNRELWRMVRIAKGYGLKVWVSTTLNHLPEGGARELVASGLDRLNVSIDGVRQESYERYRVGGDLETVMKNLGEILEEKRKQASRLPLVRWQFIAMKHNEHEISEADNLARSLGIDFKIKLLRLDMADFNEGPLRARVACDSQWLPVNKEHNRYSSPASQGKADNGACRYLWDRISINWDGLVAPCCRVYRTSNCFTSIINGGFRHVWNSPTYRHARRLFTGGKSNGKTVCDRCVAQGNVN